MTYDCSDEPIKKHGNYKTGLAPAGPRSSIYNTWCNMRQRCNNPKHPKYPRYGGRGVRVCQEWGSIEIFSKWAFENGWAEGLTIDRINNDGDYTPENCRWVSSADNSRRKSTSRLSPDDVEKIRERLANGEGLAGIAEDYGVVHGTIWHIEKGITHVSDYECTKKLKEFGRIRKNLTTGEPK